MKNEQSINASLSFFNTLSSFYGNIYMKQQLSSWQQ